ncbi:MAG: uroporphyrinogen-III synthase [Alphaproteobacteria bacterium]|jgi:uroporphyrinogen-III synthase|nr:uroporphyrinogen-III synthase [Alphaproteobacteria bacterium]
MRLLITRPEPDNQRTAAVLRVQGHEVVLAPLLHIEAVADADLGPPPWSAVLITSANGARALAVHPRRGELLALPVLAVGRSTAEAARATGFADVISADGDAEDLARLARERFAGSRQPLLYLAGEDRSGELAVPGLAVRTVVVYRAARTQRFPTVARTALERGEIDGVLHFSRRSVDSYLDCGRDIIGPALKPAHYCLSARAAEPLRLAGAAHIRVASRPDEASLLALVTPKVMPKP